MNDARFSRRSCTTSASDVRESRHFAVESLLQGGHRMMIDRLWFSFQFESSGWVNVLRKFGAVPARGLEMHWGWVRTSGQTFAVGDVSGDGLADIVTLGTGADVETSIASFEK